MGAADSLPERINESQAKELAGELWNQYIYDSLVDEDGLADKKDVVDAASEALMAFQGESVEIMRVTSRQRKSSTKSFETNQAYARSVYESKKSRNRPKLKICQIVHMGEMEDLVSLCEVAEMNVVDELDTKIDKTALQLASYYGFNNICDFLIEKGCNINKRNKEFKTALHYAAQVGNWDVVTLLMKKGADPDLKDHMGRFAGDWVESDYSSHGFVKQDATRIPEMKELLTPRDPKLHLYTGPRTGKENDPPSAEVVAVEINTDSFQVGTKSQSQSNLHRTSRSLKSEGTAGESSQSIRRTVISVGPDRK